MPRPLAHDLNPLGMVGGVDILGVLVGSDRRSSPPKIRQTFDSEVADTGMRTHGNERGVDDDDRNHPCPAGR